MICVVTNWVAWLNALSFAFAILVVEKEMELKVSPRVWGGACTFTTLFMPQAGNWGYVRGGNCALINLRRRAAHQIAQPHSRQLQPPP